MFKMLENFFMFKRQTYPFYPHAALIKYRNFLETIPSTSNLVFSPSNTLHTDMISDSTRIFATNLKILMQIDFKICIAFAAGICAILFSVILPFSTQIAIFAFCTCTYYIGKRTQAEHDYRNALENIVGFTKWTLADASWGISTGVQNRTPNVDQLVNCAPIVNMFKAIAPWLTQQQRLDILDDNIEELFEEIAAQDARKQQSELLSRPLTERERAKLYGIYGYQQGSLYDIGSGLIYLIGRCFRFVKQQFTSDGASSPDASREGSVTHPTVDPATLAAHV
jgi:hypothetical protein